MSPEKEKILIERYPKIFGSKDPNNLFCAYCFDHGDGWFSVIDSLCFVIQNHVDNLRYKHVNMSQEDFDEAHQVVAAQVKEKFGLLRVYFDNADAFINGATSIAELMSGKICEYCGEAGSRRGCGYIQTLCDKCNKQKSIAPKD